MKDSSTEEVIIEGLSHEEMADMAEQAESLETQSIYLDDEDDRIEVLIEAAGIYEELAHEPVRALRVWESILEIDSKHTEALESIERIATEHGQWSSIADLVIRRIAEAESGRERVELYHQLAKIQDEGERELGKAFLSLQAAFREDITDETTAVFLEKVARRAGRLSELLTFYNSIISELVDVEVKVELSTRLGRWYLELDHLDYAAACLNQTLQHSPNHSGALSSLAEVYRRQEQWEPLGQLLTHFASVATETSDKRDALVALGELYEERFQELASASASFRAALQLDPLCVDASRGLERVSQGGDDWDALVVALSEQLKTETDTDEAVVILRKMTTIHEDHRHDREAAIAALQGIISLVPDDTRALNDLDSFLSEEQHWDELVSVLERLAADASSERVRINLLMRLAMVFDNRLSMPNDAAKTLESVVAIEAKNEVALTALERLYRNLEQWDDLARTYERQLDATDDAENRFDLFHELGLVAFDQLQDSPAAIKAWEGARALDREDARVLEGLSLAYEDIEDWRRASSTLKQLIEVLSEPKHRVEPHYRLAQILDGSLSDPRKAVTHLKRAIEIDPHHQQALIMLKDLYLDREEWRDAALILEQLQDLTEDTQERSELLDDLGAINDIYLKNAPRAEECFILALDYDPNNLAAAGNLVELLFEQERYDEAAPLFDVILQERNFKLLERPQLHRVHFLRGQTLRALDDDRGAIRALKAAFDIEPQHLPTLQGLASLQLKLEMWDRAFKTFQMLMVHHREELSSEEMVEVFHSLGVSTLRMGERRKALNMFDKALQINADHQPTLEAVLAFHEKQGEWKKVIEVRKTLLKYRRDDERVSALTELASIYLEKTRDSDKAIECIDEALTLQPKSFPLLHKLVDIYTAGRLWEKAIESIRRIAELERDGPRLSRCYRSMAVLYRDKLDEPKLAVANFESCLDYDSTQLKSFEAIDRILTTQKDWAGLEVSYRKMLQRIQGQGERDLEISLWHFLGEIYRTRLKKFDEAADAFTMAANLEPDNVERHVILAEIYESIPSAAGKAIEKHQLLISQDPFRVESYTALARLYKETRQYDKAWCLCGALSFFNKASPDESRYYKDYKGGNIQRERGVVGGELWLKRLVAPDEDLYVGKIFETILPVLRKAHIQPVKAFGLKKKHRFDPVKGTSPVGEDFRWAAQTLGLVPPELYLKDDLGVPFLYAFTDPAASIGDESLLAALGPKEAKFELARHLTSYRGEHYIRCIEPGPEELRRLFLAAMQVVRPSVKVPDDVSGMLYDTVETLQEGLSIADKERLAALVDRVIHSKATVDTEIWLRAIEVTSFRAGLLLCGDLLDAIQALKRRPPEAFGLKLDDVIRHLVAFSVSERYFELRQAVGFSIEN